MRITQYDDRVLFEYEEHAGRREILFGERWREASEHNRFGQHVAYYEGNELIIESSHLLDNLANGGGNALSDQTTTIERYRRVDDSDIGPMIEMSMEITDPSHLTDTWNIKWLKIFTADGLDFVEVDCKLPLEPIQ